MRKILSLLAACILCLLCFSAVAESDPVLEAWSVHVQSELDALIGKSDGWCAYILSHAKIKSVGYTGKNDRYAEAVITLPNLQVNKKAETLSEAMADYISCENLTETTMTATFEESNGSYTFTWGVKKPATVHSAAKGIASRSKKGYTTKAFQALLTQELLPHAATAPKKKPKDGSVPAMSDLPDAYTESVGAALGITGKQASLRLPGLLMLTEISKVDTTEQLKETVITIKTKNWTKAISKALTMAKAELDTLVNPGAMSREQIEEVYCRQLSAVWIDYYYNAEKKDITSQTITFDLPAAVTDGPGASLGLVTLLEPAMKSIDECLDEAMAYAATLPYYPTISQLDTGFLSGGDDAEAGGNRVQFDCGSNRTDHAYVVVQRNGSTLFKAFIHTDARLNVRLNPGDYTIYYGKGPQWYGTNYLFGEEGEYGCFEVSIPAADMTKIHMEDGGSIPVTTLTDQDLLALQ